jgi:hypothetical protein
MPNTKQKQNESINVMIWNLFEGECREIKISSISVQAFSCSLCDKVGSSVKIE